ncbi:tetratricopeptide repeat protein [Geobacter sp.]|uniref:tetratricopeptide repeat protein n=1 Tax=Geobacter sp. TaxID=46610 RepID=UPI0026082E93|nr:tetratricopeptide repeat protein [Geobacter sp.]
MFIRKLFRKGHESYREKGEKLLAAGRVAEARSLFQDALESLPSDCPGREAVETQLRERIALAGNRLAELNLEEARHALKSGEIVKAEEHLNLALDLAEDVTIREKAEKILAATSGDEPHEHGIHAGAGCSGCHGTSCQPGESATFSSHGLIDSDRFELLVRPLPGDLPERYLDLGKEFAEGYLAADAGDTATARAVYEDLLSRGENDILRYEVALLDHRAGDMERCERQLRRALELNDANPLCNLVLVQLLGENGRFAEAIPHLQGMVERNILPEQAEMYLGDIHHAQGDNPRAIEHYSRLLSGQYKREAAERLAGVLVECGRNDEAEFVAKQYLKGCC